jgi:hypothetical protein
MSEKIKIEDLRIGQKVWHEGQEKTINYLYDSGNYSRVGFAGENGKMYFNEGISLTPTKKKVKYYFASFSPINGIRDATCLYRSKTDPNLILSEDRSDFQIHEIEVEE